MLLFAATMENEVREGDLRLRKKTQLFGAMNLLWAIMFGHRSGVHANMTDEMVRGVQEEGSAQRGFVVQVSDYSVNHKCLIRRVEYLHLNLWKEEPKLNLN